MSEIELQMNCERRKCILLRSFCLSLKYLTTLLDCIRLRNSRQISTKGTNFNT